MKKILICLFVIIIYSSNVYANNYYAINDGVWTFNILEKNEYKKLTKKEKEEYKKLKKANGLAMKGDREADKNNKYNASIYWHKSLSLNPDLLPSAYNLFLYYYNKKDYKTAIAFGEYLNQKDLNYKKETSYELGNAYYGEKNYANAISAMQNWLSFNSNYPEITNWANLIISDSYLELGEQYPQYKKYDCEMAILFANRVSDLELNERAAENKYKAYFRLEKKELALQQAYYLLGMSKTYTNYMRISACSQGEKNKLENYYKAKLLAPTQDDLSLVNDLIATYEQRKVDGIVKKLCIYVKKPDWWSIYNSCKYGNIKYWSNRQDEFFESTNNCINNYTGNNLVACFNSINTEQDRLTANLNNEVYQGQQLAIEQEKAMYQSELVRQQQHSNYYQQQQTRAINNLNYNITKPTTYTVNPIGNSLYINKY